MSGVYWGLSALNLLGTDDSLDKSELLDWVMDCYKDCGGFGASERNDPHLLYTLSALQILVMLDSLHLADADKIVSCAWYIFWFLYGLKLTS